MSIRVSTLGRFGISQDGVERPELLARKSRCVILIFLGIEREASRDTLANLLWPDWDSERSRRALSQALHEIRKACGANCIETNGDILRVDPAELEVDARSFLDAVEDGRYADALPLFGGHFLDGVHLSSNTEFESWTDQMRGRLRRRHRKARTLLIQGLISGEKHQEALEVARGWVELDPLDDEAQQSYIDLLGRTGRRSEALRQFESFEKLLAENDFEPMEELQEVVRLIREGSQPAAKPRESPGDSESTVDSVVRSPTPQGQSGGGEFPKPPLILRFSNVLRQRWAFRTALGYTALVALALEAIERLEGELSWVTQSLLAELTVAAFCLIPLVAALGWVLDPGVGRVGGDESGPSGGKLRIFRRFIRRRGFPLIPGGGVSAILLLTLWPAGPQKPPIPGDVLENSLAILYFKAEGEREDIRNFAHQLTDELIQHFAPLQEISPLTVFTRNAVERSRDSAFSSHEIANALGAHYLVDGSLSEIGGDSILVRVSLENPWNGTSLWDDAIIESGTGAWEYSLVRAVAVTIASELRRQVGSEIREREINLGTESEEAYAALVAAKGQYEVARRLLFRTGRESLMGELERTRNLFQAAAGLDSRWAEPHIRLGKVAETAALYFTELQDPVDPEAALREIRRGLESLEWALELDPGNPRALAGRGGLHFNRWWSLSDPGEARLALDEAEASLQRAVAGDPTLAVARSTLSEIQFVKGNFAVAKVMAGGALEEDAFLEREKNLRNQLARASLNLGESEEALALCRELQEEGGGYWAYECELEVLAWGDISVPMPDRAHALADTILALGSQETRGDFRSRVLFELAGALATAEMTDSASALIGAAKEAVPEEMVMWQQAAAEVRVGNLPEALTVLERLLEKDPIRGAGYLHWRVFNPLRSDPRFRQLQARLPN